MFLILQPLLGSPSNDAVLNAGAFLIKSLELQQTIEQSTRDYKIFWCWLYGVIIRLMEETVPDDIAAVTQQDIIYLAEFLNNFDLNTGDLEATDNNATMAGDESTAAAAPPRKRFNLERVGQYLEDKNLQTQSMVDLTQKWNQLLDDNECLKNCDFIYPHQKHLSLVQQHNLLKKSIGELFSRPERLMSTHFKLKSAIDCVGFQDDVQSVRTCHWNVEATNASLFAGLIAQKMLFIVELKSAGSAEAKAIKLEFQGTTFLADKFSMFGNLSFRDVQFYNDEHMSMLLHSSVDQRLTNCFVQFPLAALATHMARVLLVSTSQNANVVDITHVVPVCNFLELLDPTLIRTLDGSDGVIVSVSGSRKVASLLSESQKRIRLYEMEVEEEEEDVDMSQNASLDASKESNQST